MCISRQTLQNSSGKLYKTIIQQLPQTSYPQILAPSRWHNTHQKLAHPFHPTLLMTSHCSQMFSRGPGLIHHQWKDLNGSLQHRNKPFENLRKNQGWGVALKMFFGSRRKDIQLLLSSSSSLSLLSSLSSFSSSSSLLLSNLRHFKLTIVQFNPQKWIPSKILMIFFFLLPKSDICSQN